MLGSQQQQQKATARTSIQSEDSTSSLLKIQQQQVIEERVFAETKRLQDERDRIERARQEEEQKKIRAMQLESERIRMEAIKAQEKANAEAQAAAQKEAEANEAKSREERWKQERIERETETRKRIVDILFKTASSSLSSPPQLKDVFQSITDLRAREYCMSPGCIDLPGKPGGVCFRDRCASPYSKVGDVRCLGYVDRNECAPPLRKPFDQWCSLCRNLQKCTFELSPATRHHASGRGRGRDHGRSGEPGNCCNEPAFLYDLSHIVSSQYSSNQDIFDNRFKDERPAQRIRDTMATHFCLDHQPRICSYSGKGGCDKIVFCTPFTITIKTLGKDHYRFLPVYCDDHPNNTYMNSRTAREWPFLPASIIMDPRMAIRWPRELVEYHHHQQQQRQQNVSLMMSNHGKPPTLQELQQRTIQSSSSSSSVLPTTALFSINNMTTPSLEYTLPMSITKTLQRYIGNHKIVFKQEYGHGQAKSSRLICSFIDPVSLQECLCAPMNSSNEFEWLSAPEPLTQACMEHTCTYNRHWPFDYESSAVCNNPAVASFGKYRYCLMHLDSKQNPHNRPRADQKEEEEMLEAVLKKDRVFCWKNQKMPVPCQICFEPLVDPETTKVCATHCKFHVDGRSKETQCTERNSGYYGLYCTGHACTNIDNCRSKLPRHAWSCSLCADCCRKQTNPCALVINQTPSPTTVAMPPLRSNEKNGHDKGDSKSRVLDVQEDEKEEAKDDDDDDKEEEENDDDFAQNWLRTVQEKDNHRQQQTNSKLVLPSSSAQQQHQSSSQTESDSNRPSQQKHVQTNNNTNTTTHIDKNDNSNSINKGGDEKRDSSATWDFTQPWPGDSWQPRRCVVCKKPNVSVGSFACKHCVCWTCNIMPAVTVENNGVVFQLPCSNCRKQPCCYPGKTAVQMASKTKPMPDSPRDPMMVDEIKKTAATTDQKTVALEPSIASKDPHASPASFANKSHHYNNISNNSHLPCSRAVGYVWIPKPLKIEMVSSSDRPMEYDDCRVSEALYEDDYGCMDTSDMIALQNERRVRATRRNAFVLEPKTSVMKRRHLKRGFHCSIHQPQTCGTGHGNRFFSLWSGNLAKTMCGNVVYGPILIHHPSQSPVRFACERCSCIHPSCVLPCMQWNDLRLLTCRQHTFGVCPFQRFPLTWLPEKYQNDDSPSGCQQPTDLPESHYCTNDRCRYELSGPRCSHRRKNQSKYCWSHALIMQ
jgi:hypothetical protein